MPQYRKKPVQIEARQWNGTPEAATPIIDWILESGQTAGWVGVGEPHFLRPNDESDAVPYVDEVRLVVKPDAPEFIWIRTLEGTMRADVGDYIIRGVEGEFYPCKPGIFEKTYDEVTPAGFPLAGHGA